MMMEVCFCAFAKEPYRYRYLSAVAPGDDVSSSHSLAPRSHARPARPPHTATEFESCSRVESSRTRAQQDLIIIGHLTQNAVANASLGPTR